MILRDLTRAELKDIMRDILQELLWELEQELPDPDAGLNLRPEIVEQLSQYQHNKSATKSLDEVASELRT